MKISGNTVIITGGATGIGLALTESFLAAGNKVIICGRRESRLLEVQAKHPEIQFKVCDIFKEEDRRALFSWVKENFNDLNILVNNAGIQQDIDLTKGEEDLIANENGIAINFEAPIYLSALFIPFLARKEKSAIINISSGLAILPMALMPIYCATKAGLHTFTMCLRSQLSDTDIKVFEVLPPAVESELNMKGRAKRAAKGDHSMPMMKADEFVPIVMKGIANDELEIFSPMQQNLKMATRTDIDKIFERMNRRPK